MSELDTGKLRKVAEAATRGAWEWERDEGDGTPLYLVSEYDLFEYIVETDSGVYGPHGPDATYIATFDPPTVLELLDRLESEKEALRQIYYHLSGGCECCEATQDRLREYAPWLYDGSDDA